MSKFTRRRFLGTSMVAPVGLGLASSPARAESALGDADMIVTGGRVLTMDSYEPLAEALAVRGSFILAVGSNDDIRNLAGSSTKRIDARGMTITPGFIDAHSHPLFAEEALGVNVNLPRIEDVKQALKGQAAKTPPGHWVRGVMYDDTIFEEERPLTRKDIDEAVSDHPVFVGHRGGHTAVVNSKGFEVAGVTMDTPDPVGGKYFREDGEFTGKVAEHALDVFRAAGTWPLMDRRMRQQSAKISSLNMAAAGLTSTTDAYGAYDDFIAYQDARDAGELFFRLSFMPGGNSEVYEGLKTAGVRSGFGDDMLRIGAVKFSADGSASERTMSMSTPYEGRPTDFGILTMTQEQIDDAVDDAVAHGFRIGIHANGDVAIDMVLNAYERVLKNYSGPNPRHRIEHCSLINDSLLARIKAAGVVPAPFYTYAYYHGNKWVEYGPEKMQSMFAHRSFLDAGIPVAPASDYTPGPYEPMMAIQSMVTRKDQRGRVWGPDQRVTVTEAMRICTMHGAYASFEEDIKGSLVPGKLADFVILEKDPHDVDPDSIIKIKVLRTVLGGRTVYEA
ncbi:MAG: amidohydrolase [Gammaproteobacteria bacterium]|nr:amidohydrolase [Gammaproteobacteria bacterium]MDH5499928.1 amidohydrolase [Gammaproteobacteria bacterium]